MVLPKQLFSPLMPNELSAQELLAAQYPSPRGVLKVRLVAARKLPVKELSLFSQVTRDLYCIVSLGTQTWTSSVAEEDCSPSWGHDDYAHFTFSYSDQELKIDVYGKNMIAGADILTDDRIGRLRLTIAQLATMLACPPTLRQKQEVPRLWLPLDCSEGGEVCVEFEPFTVETKPASSPKFADVPSASVHVAAVLRVLIDAVLVDPLTAQDRAQSADESEVEDAQWGVYAWVLLDGDEHRNVRGHRRLGSVVRPWYSAKISQVFEFVIEAQHACAGTLEFYLTEDGDVHDDATVLVGRWSWTAKDVLSRPSLEVQAVDPPLTSQKFQGATIAAAVELLTLQPGYAVDKMVRLLASRAAIWDRRANGRVVEMRSWRHVRGNL